MDNASYHRSASVQAALSLYADRLLVVWLPKYDPYLNPIECFWLHLKQFTVANRLYSSLHDLSPSLERFLETPLNRWFHPDRLYLTQNLRPVAWQK